MAKKKLRTVLIKLVSTARTGFFYVTRKNPMNTPNKLLLKKFDPMVNRHVLFEEQKHRSGKAPQAKAKKKNKGRGR